MAALHQQLGPWALQAVRVWAIDDRSGFVKGEGTQHEVDLL